LRQLCECSFIAREWITDMHQTCLYCSLTHGRVHGKVKTPDKASRVRVPTRAVSAARKLSRIEERRQHEVVCLEDKITTMQATALKNVLGPGSKEDGFCASKTKHDRGKASRPKLFVSKRILRKQRSHPRKNVLGSSQDKDGFWRWKTKLCLKSNADEHKVTLIFHGYISSPQKNRKKWKRKANLIFCLPFSCDRVFLRSRIIRLLAQRLTPPLCA
jgi:hypothetical protein